MKLVQSNDHTHSMDISRTTGEDPATSPHKSRTDQPLTQVTRATTPNADYLAFEDVRYFATDASMHLSRLQDVFDALEAGRLDPNRLLGLASVMAGTCRSLDRTLRDVRDTANRRLNPHPDPAPGNQPRSLHAVADQLVVNAAHAQPRAKSA